MAYDESSVKKLVNNPLLEKGTELISVNAGDMPATDILPAYADIELGNYFSYIDIGDEQLITRMREEGISDEEIFRHRYIISSVVETSDTATLDAAYVPKKRELYLYPKAALQQKQRALESALKEDGSANSYSFTAPETDFSAGASDSLFHEIRHMRQYTVEKNGDQLTDAYYATIKKRHKLGKIATIAASIAVATGIEAALGPHDFTTHFLALETGLGMSAIGVFGLHALKTLRKLSYYWNDPTEIDARKAGSEASANVATVIPKAEQSLRTRPEGTLSRRQFLTRIANPVAKQ